MADTEAVLDKAKKLVALATSADTEEGRSAAIALTRLMKEEELVLIPMKEMKRIERTIEGMRQAAKEAGGEKMQNMAIGAFVGFIASGGKLKL